MRRDALHVAVDHEGDAAIRFEQQAVNRVVPRPPLSPDTPDEARESAEADAVARHGHANERLAVAVVPPRHAHVDWEEPDEHVVIKRVSIDACKIHVARPLLVVAVDLEQAKVLVSIVAPRHVRPRDGDDDEASAMELQVSARIHEPPSILVHSRQLAVKPANRRESRSACHFRATLPRQQFSSVFCSSSRAHHDVVRTTARVPAPTVPAVEGELVLPDLPVAVG